MSRLPVLLSSLLMSAACLWLNGCTAPPDDGPTGTTSAAIGDGQQQTHDDQAGPVEMKVDQGAIEEALAELSGEDRALAEKQKICPVSGELLGSMGAPVKADVKGQVVFLCCAGCEDPLQAEPEKYLAKLGL